MVRTFRQPMLIEKIKSPKKTCQSRTKNISTSTMNKHQRRMRGRKIYRGQGR